MQIHTIVMEMHWGMRFGGVRSGFGPGRWFDICPYPDTNPDAFPLRGAWVWCTSHARTGCPWLMTTLQNAAIATVSYCITYVYLYISHDVTCLSSYDCAHLCLTQKHLVGGFKRNADAVSTSKVVTHEFHMHSSSFATFWTIHCRDCKVAG